jgi:hypothetical protein
MQCKWPNFCTCKECRKDWLPLIQGQTQAQKLREQLKERNVPTRGIFG